MVPAYYHCRVSLGSGSGRRILLGAAVAALAVALVAAVFFAVMVARRDGAATAVNDPGAGVVRMDGGTRKDADARAVGVSEASGASGADSSPQSPVQQDTGSAEAQEVPTDAVSSSPRREFLEPIPPGPEARTYARWTPVYPASGGEIVPAVSSRLGGRVRVVTTDSATDAADRVALAVATESWDAVGRDDGSQLPEYVVDAVRRVVTGRGPAAWVYAVDAPGDEATFLLGFPGTPVLLRVYQTNGVVDDLEAEPASDRSPDR